MISSRALLLATVATAAVATAAQAQPVDGLYVGAGAGLNLLQGGKVVATAPPGGAKADWGAGFLMSGSVGYGLGNGVRLELELDYRNNQQSGAGGGHQSQFGGMANALYDIDAGLAGVTPYVGLGAGYQSTRWSGIRLRSAGAAADDVTASATLGGFAWQALVGLAVPVAAVPGLALTAEYRFTGLTGSRDVAAGAGGRVHASEDGNHSLLLGVRYAFGTPEDAPVPRPPLASAAPEAPASPAVAAPARTYLVFFDLQRAELTPRARDIIAEAVRNAAHAPFTRIEVAGHADLSGTPQSNQQISLKRAQAVAGELEHWGVPSSEVDIHAFGASHPLVPTDPGVTQEENRRVEIVYR